MQLAHEHVQTCTTHQCMHVLTAACFKVRPCAAPPGSYLLGHGVSLERKGEDYVGCGTLPALTKERRTTRVECSQVQTNVRLKSLLN
eukprot:1160043-Pelagomonas_calceolata.AAC.3